MQSELNSIIKDERQFRAAKIFGYRSNGIPGLDLVGPSARCRIIKEKVIYYSRLAKVPIPLKRFVIGIEIPHSNHRIQSIDDLEFGILIMYWWLCEVLPINQLSRLWVWGKLDPSGIIYQRAISPEEIPCEHTVLWPSTNPYQRVIYPDDLLKGFPQISFAAGEKYPSPSSNLLLHVSENQRTMG